MEAVPEDVKIPLGAEAFPALEVLNAILDRIDAARERDQGAAS